MLEITNVKLSKNTVNTGEKYVISVDINEIIDYPYDYPCLLYTSRCTVTLTVSACSPCLCFNCMIGTNFTW